MIIINAEKHMEPIDICNSFEPLYFEAGLVKFKSYRGDISLVELTNAMKSGKSCISYSFCDLDDCSALNWFVSRSFNWSAILEELGALPWDERAKEYDPITLDGVKVYRREQKAIRVYSPFNLAVMKPLKEEPKKWTLRHVLRALVNGQFQELKCDGRYSDDYALDAADNFGRGKIESAKSFAKRIMESPSGWWTHKNGGWVSICCHHFDSNSFVFKL
jgi:hypothetical protein